MASLLSGVGIGIASDLRDCPSSGYFHNCFGTYTWSDGSKYIGEWKHDDLHGQGTFIWSDGDKYVGEWKDGKRNGQGVYTFTSGAKIIGTFKGAKLDGFATWYHLDGTILKQGIWKLGEFQYVQISP